LTTKVATHSLNTFNKPNGYWLIIHVLNISANDSFLVFLFLNYFSPDPALDHKCQMKEMTYLYLMRFWVTVIQWKCWLNFKNKV